MSRAQSCFGAHLARGSRSGCLRLILGRDHGTLGASIAFALVLWCADIVSAFAGMVATTVVAAYIVMSWVRLFDAGMVSRFLKERARNMRYFVPLWLCVDAHKKYVESLCKMMKFVIDVNSEARALRQAWPLQPRSPPSLLHLHASKSMLMQKSRRAMLSKP